jgi:transcriptional regulator with XRE-family HTH domain
MDDLRLLGLRIRQLRRKADLTQEQLAEHSEIHYKFLGGIERGTENATLLVLTKIAQSLGVPLPRLFDYDVLAENPKQIRRLLVEGIKRCTDEEVTFLYRVLRSL